jgi:tetratricopeptide (TPR) repeat protein
MRFIIVLCLLSLSSTTIAQRDSFLKSKGAYKNRFTIGDTVLVNDLIRIALDSAFTNADRAYLFASQANRIAYKVEYNHGICASYLTMATTKVYLNEFDSAHYFVDRCINRAKKYNDIRNQVEGHELKGNIYTYETKYERASQELLKGVKIAERKQPRLALGCYANLALVFKRTDNVEKCEKYAQKSYTLSKKYQDTSVAITALNLLGLVYKNDSTVSLPYFREGLEYATLSNNIKRQSEILYNMSNVYFDYGEDDIGFRLFDESLELSKANKSFQNLMVGYHSMAYNYYQVGRMYEAANYADSALKYARLTENNELIMESLAMKAQMKYVNGDPDSAMFYLNQAYELKDSVYLNANTSKIAETEAKYEAEKEKLKADLIRKKERELAQQQIWWRDLLLWISGFIVVIVLIGSILLFRSNKRIHLKNLLVEKQKKEIEIQHEEIASSIQYAKRIQSSMLSSEDWHKLSSDLTLLFMPKDVVSGDFFWIHHDQQTDVFFWAIADCTGHGVPGALMSMLGTGFLNEIVGEKRVLDPGEILSELRDRIVSTFKGSIEESNDGIDMALCSWKKGADKIKFAGANNGVYRIRDRVLVTYDPDKMPIGNYFNILSPFITKEIDIQAGDHIVLYTDGYPDQFGGPKNKKLKYAVFKEFLVKATTLPIAQREDFLRYEFENWKGEGDQTDDVCVLVLGIDDISDLSS